MYKVWNKKVYPKIPSIGEYGLKIVVETIVQCEPLLVLQLFISCPVTYLCLSQPILGIFG
jgi:hypothetical protein